MRYNNLHGQANDALELRTIYLVKRRGCVGRLSAYRYECVTSSQYGFAYALLLVGPGNYGHYNFDRSFGWFSGSLLVNFSKGC